MAWTNKNKNLQFGLAVTDLNGSPMQNEFTYNFNQYSIGAEAKYSIIPSISHSMPLGTDARLQYNAACAFNEDEITAMMFNLNIKIENFRIGAFVRKGDIPKGLSAGPAISFENRAFKLQYAYITPLEIKNSGLIKLHELSVQLRINQAWK